MATYSSVLAWRIPGTGEPGGLPSMKLHRVGHDWSDLAAAAATVCISVYFSSGLSCMGLSALLGLDGLFPFPWCESFQLSLQKLSQTFFFSLSLSSSSSGTPIIQMLICLIFSQRSLRHPQIFSFLSLYSLFSCYFHHSIFQLTYPFFCLSYSAIDSF